MKAKNQTSLLISFQKSKRRRTDSEELELHPSKDELSLGRDKKERKRGKKKKRKRSPTPSSSSSDSSNSSSDSSSSSSSTSSKTSLTKKEEPMHKTKEETSNIDTNYPKKREEIPNTSSAHQQIKNLATTKLTVGKTEHQKTKEEMKKEKIDALLTDYFKNKYKCDHTNCCNKSNPTYPCRHYNDKGCDEPCSHYKIETKPYQRPDIHRRGENIKRTVFVHACTTCIKIRKTLDYHSASCKNCPVARAREIAGEHFD